MLNKIFTVMKKVILLSAVILLTCCGREKEAKWDLVWSDEFEYSGLPDSTKWGNEVGFIRNNELQYYTERRIENSVVHDGNLLIIGRKERFDTANYTSASLTTDRKHAWTFGKIEARMKLPKGQGMWPAFWMLGQNVHELGWPECGEIDIMEHINNDNFVHGTLHWYNKDHLSSGKTAPCDVTQYHSYAIEWDSDSIKWLLDGKQYHQLPVKSEIIGNQAFQLPFYIILNLAIGGSWPKDPDETTQFPDTVFVDYVRVYQKAEE
ncbi:MAG: glycoside hydrolase family 16 protein [Bacteroidales bacterium]|nr:glycoside hydrolase family 16 protein [Bacteroidales bacterium]